MTKVIYFLMIFTLYSAFAEDETKICNLCECLEPLIVDCDDMELKKIPDIGSHLNSTKRITFTDNELKNVTKFRYMAELQYLSFSYNGIFQIEDLAFSDIPKLKVLDFSHNLLNEERLTGRSMKGPGQEYFPDPLMNLQILNISYNKFNKLPKHAMKHLINLTVLSVRYNPLKTLSSSSTAALSEVPKLEILDLAYTQLERLPDHAFADLRSLKTLDLSGNFFHQMPSEINYIPSLRTLILNENLLEVISPGYFYTSAENLQELYLNNLPNLILLKNYAFANLTNLRKLSISQNSQLMMIQPYAFINFQNKTLALEEVNLSHNNLNTLPGQAVNWISVRSLDLQYNPWNCDCYFEEISKKLIPQLRKRNVELTLNIICASPYSLMGQTVTSLAVQEATLECSSPKHSSGSMNFTIMMTVFIGILFFACGTLLFAYLILKKSGSQSWIATHVHYRRTNFDEDSVSTINS